MMAKLEREPKDPVRKGRAELVKAVAAEEWAARSGSKLEKQGRDGLKLVVAKAPDYILDGDGEIVGVDAWVQLFDERGRELPIDPHRRIINPPTVPRSGVRIIDTGQLDPRLKRTIAERQVTADPVAAFWEAVWDSVESTPNEAGWRTRGTVTTVFSPAADGLLEATSTAYLGARSGPASSVSTAFSVRMGQQAGASGNYFCMEGFVSFDTSAIADSDVVSTVVLDLWLLDDQSIHQDFVIEARTKDWGATLTTADWIDGASLGSQTLLASLSSVGIGASGAYKTFTSGAAFLTATNLKTGVVYVMLNSDQHRLGVSPGTAGGATTFQGYIDFVGGEASGTTQDPKLTVTHAAPGSSPFFTHRPNRIWRLG